MARRKPNRTARNLKILIGILALILAALLALATGLSGNTEPDPTDTTAAPSTQEPGTTAPSTETVPPTTLPPTGWVERDGKRYYYGDDSVLRTGAQELDGSIYCFGQDGALLEEGWQDIGQERYYVTADGTAYIGWLELEDQLYYLHTDGHMARGQVEIDGQRWFFTSTGCQIYVVNPWNYVPEDYHVELVKLPDQYGNNRYVAEELYEPLMQMLRDCEAYLVEQYGSKATAMFVRSSNRTNSDQAYLFQNKVDRVMAAHPEYTREQAEAEAATVVAIPGTSEHQLGLAVDIIDTALWDLVEAQETLPGQQWLMAHCHEYGFILRYPKGTTDVTGIIYEPWHYRYVGLELAAEIHELGVTLEEYIDSLS